MEKNPAYGKFLKGIIFWGRLTLLMALALSFVPALYLWLVHGYLPESAVLLKALGIISATIVVSWLVEPIAYFPIVGISGTYMSWLAGNISNMRVPVSAIAQQSAGVQEGSPEGDIASTLGIGVSVLINLVVLFLAVLFGIQVIDALPTTVQKAFNFILPAVFGAVLANFALRNLKLGLLALTTAFILTTLKAPVWITLPVCVFGTMLVGVWFFNQEVEKKAAQQAANRIEKERKVK